MSILDKDPEFFEKSDKDIIMRFIRDNYWTLPERVMIRPDENTGMYIVDVNGPIALGNKKLKSLTNGIFRFGTINGSFFCVGSDCLENLDGAPHTVKGSFVCVSCKHIKDIKKSPYAINMDVSSYEDSERDICEVFDEFSSILIRSEPIYLNL